MTHLELVENKICTLEQIKPLLNVWRFHNQKIVFTNGCFDLLHLGHIDYLAKASDLGNKLIIGLNSDRSITQLKGPNRPITNEQSRAGILASLFFVDAVILFDESTPVELITQVKPDILVKGADYTIEQIVGADVVLKNGGLVNTLSYLPGYSTTAIEEKIKRTF